MYFLFCVGDECDVVLYEDGTSGEALRRAQNQGVTCCRTEWAVQCLIMGNRVDYDEFICT